MRSIHTLPKPIADALRRETAGEPVRWIGRPDARLTFLKGAPIWLMGVPWTAFSGTMFGLLVTVLLSEQAPLVMIPAWQVVVMGAAVIFVASFVLVGLGMLAAPIWLWWRASRTVHAITNRRLVSITVGRSTTVTSVAPQDMLKIERRERRDGTGTLRITIGARRDAEGSKSDETEELIGIPEVARAARHLEDLKLSGAR